MAAEWYQAPTFYFTNPYALLGAHDDVAVPPGCPVLGSGTCGNGGCLAELWGRSGKSDPPPLRPGDIVELAVEGIGTVRNRVVEGVALPPVREARTRSVPKIRKRG